MERGAATGLLGGAVPARAIRLGLVVLASVFAGLLALSFATGGEGGLETPFGQPLGGDYVAKRAAALLAGPAAYDVDRFQAAIAAIAGGGPFAMTWQYPPTYYLAIAWMAFVPYTLGYVAWGGLNAGLFAVAVREAAPAGWRLAALAAPPAYLCLVSGQNGLAAAALLFFAATRAGPRPMLAGLAAGVLAMKPHLGVLLPLAWAAGGHWRALGWGAAASVGLALLAAALFGPETWALFADRLAATGEAAAAGFYPYGKMATPFAAARAVGAPGFPAFALQGLFCLAAAWAVFTAWRRPAPIETKAAVLLAAALFVPPYAYLYVLPLGVLAGALVALRAIRTEPLAWEWESLAALWLASASLQAAGGAGLPLGFLALLGLGAVVARRAAADGALVAPAVFRRTDRSSAPAQDRGLEIV